LLAAGGIDNKPARAIEVAALSHLGV